MTTPMMDAKKVEVLAVLDRQLTFTIASDYPGAFDDHRDLLASRDAVAELLIKIHNLGLLYEAGCEIDGPLAELEELAARIGAPA